MRRYLSLFARYFVQYAKVRLSYRGDFPCNTHGGQLGYGQAGMAGGMSHVIEGARQLMRRAGDRQLRRHDLAYVTGTGGTMSEQSALVLRGG